MKSIIITFFSIKKLDLSNSSMCCSKCIPPLLLIAILFYAQFSFAQVYLNEGDNFQSIVNNHPKGTHFIIKAGEHRMQTITARDGDTFEGETGPNDELLTTLKGSKILTGFHSVIQGGKQYWRKQNVIDQNTPSSFGTCLDGFDCQRAEDIFVNGLPLTKVTLLTDLDQANECFIQNDDVYLFFNPSGSLIETSVSRIAIRGNLAQSGETKGASNVTVRNLIIEHYANPAQHGAIHAGFTNQIHVPERMGFNWIVENNEVRYNHGAGIFVFTNGLMKNNYIHHNGQIGMRAAGDNVVIDGNEVAHNCEWAGYKWAWEGGGSKFVYTSNLKVINNHCYNNNGPGLWTDIENIYSIIENNRCEDNSGPGIFHEISYDATIRCNVATNNYWNIGNNTFEFYGGNIFISTSSNVEVYDNITMSNDKLKGNGILVLCEDRGIDSNGNARVSNNNHVYNNSITYTAAKNYSGAYFLENDCRGTGGNLFENNQYHSVNPNHTHFVWGSGSNKGNLSWMQSQQQDVGSSIDNNVSGFACNDNDPCTENDVFVSACNCEGTLIDIDGNGVCDNLEGCTNFVINNFENQLIDDWYSYAYANSTSLTGLSTVPQSGMHSLYAKCDVVWSGYQQAGIRNDLNSISKDWSAYLGLSFGFKGKNTGNKIYVELIDNGGEKFGYRFFDSSTDWKNFNLNWDDFFRRGGQAADIPNDGMTLTDVQSIAIHIMTDGAYEHTISQYFRIDNVQLICDSESVDNDAMNITIKAKGDYGQELMTLQINGENVGAWTVSTDWEDYQYTHTGTIDQLRVYLSNHVYVQGSIDYNLNIDYVVVGEDIIQTNDPQTYGTAVKIEGKYCNTGSDFQKEKLFCKGYIQYIGVLPNNKIAASETGLTIYPNPAEHYLQINFLETADIKSVNIFDISGKPYLTEMRLTENKMDIQQLPNGIYVVQIDMRDGTRQTERFIKN